MRHLWEDRRQWTGSVSTRSPYGLHTVSTSFGIHYIKRGILQKIYARPVAASRVKKPRHWRCGGGRTAPRLLQSKYSGTSSSAGPGGHMSEEPQSAAESPASTRSSTCPFCKEAVRPGATKCPHCQASIQSPPDHGGECPFCKEQINTEAVRCRHCKSDLGGSPPVKVSIYPVSMSARAAFAGCSECGSAARVIIGPPRPGMRRYCFEMCEEKPAGPIDCWTICVDLPDRGPAVASVVGPVVAVT